MQSLRSGVSETSVRSAAGWSSGAMVARYTRAMSAELALDVLDRAVLLGRMNVVDGERQRSADEEHRDGSAEHRGLSDALSDALV